MTRYEYLKEKHKYCLNGSTFFGTTDYYNEHRTELKELAVIESKINNLHRMQCLPANTYTTKYDKLVIELENLGVNVEAISL